MVRGFVSFTPLPGTWLGARVPGFFLLPALGAILFVSKRKNCPCNSFFVKGKRKGRSKNASPAAFFDLPFRTLTKIFLLIKWIVLGGKKNELPRWYRLKQHQPSAGQLVFTLSGGIVPRSIPHFPPLPMYTKTPELP
jgi:hypothetical protein